MLISSADFQALVSGRRRGIAASLARFGLRLVEIPYTAVMRMRNRGFDAGKHVQRVECPVISVGNLTLGGTGKTPFVAWLARRLRAEGLRVTLISRGYGAQAGARNDEALELEQQLPDVPHLQDADRVAASRVAIEEFEAQVLLLDDGFQHRRLARDLDIVLLDALDPFGCGHVFPRGTLREPLDGIRRAQAVGLSRADLVTVKERQQIRDRVLALAPRTVWFEVRHAPRSLLSASGIDWMLNSLAGKPIAAFCGIGNPLGFRRTLEQVGLQVVAFREFPDHHAYQRTDVEKLAAWADELDVTAVVCTRKDLVKIASERLGTRPLRALTIGIEFLHGQAELERLVNQLVDNLASADVSAE